MDRTISISECLSCETWIKIRDITPKSNESNDKYIRVDKKVLQSRILEIKDGEHFSCCFTDSTKHGSILGR